MSPSDVRAYLLGTLDEERRDALEAAYFADPTLADDVRSVEEALIDDSLAGTLPGADQQAFERHYLATPVHRDRVATARALRVHVAAPIGGTVVDIRERPRRPAAARFNANWLMLAAAATFAAIGILWFTTGPGAPPSQHARGAEPPPGPAPDPAPISPAPQPAPAPGSPPAASDGAAPAPGPQTEPTPPGTPEPRRGLLALTLSPIVTRGDRQKAERLPAGPADLLIHLEGRAEPADRQYIVELQTVDGRVVWEGRARAAEATSGRLASVRVSSDRLEPDDYIVAVFATAGADRLERGRYVLRLVR